MSDNMLYCSTCKAAMGYRIDPLPEVWRESWRCYVCGLIVTKDHPRYDLNRKKEKQEETEATSETPELTQTVSINQGKSSGENKLNTETEEPVVKRKRGRPRKQQ